MRVPVCLCNVQDCKLNAVADMVRAFASVVEGTTRSAPDAPVEDDPLHAIATLYQSRASSAPPKPRCPGGPWMPVKAAHAFAHLSCTYDACCLMCLGKPKLVQRLQCTKSSGISQP